jgi:DNA-binding NtrC family response regulator
MRLPGFGRKHGASPVSAPTAGTRVAADNDLIVHFAVITADDDFYLRLEQIATAYQWRIKRALSADEAQALIRTQPTPIVIYDGDSNGGNWRDAFRDMKDLPAHPCVLLASRIADDYLLQEVLRNHGYDLLPKSAPNEKLIHCLKFAWSWARARVNREDARRGKPAF